MFQVYEADLSDIIELMEEVNLLELIFLLELKLAEQEDQHHNLQGIFETFNQQT